MLVDSHCHLNLIDYKALGVEMDAVIEAALKNGVEHMLCVGTTLHDVDTILAIANSNAHISASVGLHPNEPIEVEPSIEHLIVLVADPKVIGVGETGLDYYRSSGDLSWQKERFSNHIHAAKASHKPLIVHTREAKKDTLDILKAEGADTIGGVMHCFTEDWETAKKALDLNFYISFSGILTFKNAVELQAVAKLVPIDRILIETDSPYLAPIPYRGKINQPRYVKQVAEFMAQLRNISFEEVAMKTTENFYRLFFAQK